jgi:MFS family permease
VRTAAARSFAALRDPSYRGLFFSAAGTMMADNIEHVISYWVIFQKFHSSWLAGAAVIAHWVPYLLLSVFVGALADRFDPRRLGQIGLVMFVLVSLAWGVLFLTDTLEVWHAVVLLILHGLAGLLWATPSQVLIHDVVRAELLPSAVRSNATARYVGFLVGPAVGAGLMLLFDPGLALLINAVFYLGPFIWLQRLASRRRRTARAVRGLADIVLTIRDIAPNHVLVSMILLGGAASFFIGNAYQAQMPAFATDLGHARADFSYSALLAADATGALLAGLLLESRGLLGASPRAAVSLAMVWCIALAGFAISHSYPLALVLLLVAGFVELAFGAMVQTLVQLNAPAEIRGRVLGLYNMAASGLRMFSGMTVGFAGGLIGPRPALAASAVALLSMVVLLFGMQRRRAAAA